MTAADITLLSKVKQYNDGDYGAPTVGLYEIELHDLCQRGYLQRRVMSMVLRRDQCGYWLTDAGRAALESEETK